MPPRSPNALVCILVLSLAGVNSVAAQEAELVLFGGRIWTGPGSPIAGAQATAVAVANGRVLAVGSDDAVVRFVGPPTRRIDLEGRRVVPGFMDAHTHFIDGGFELASVRLRDAATPQEFARRIGAFATAHPDGWVTGGTWDHELWGGDLPRRDWIDSLTPDTPVFVSRLDGHMGLANTRALELAGVTVDTPDPEGGTIVRYDDGRPTGILKDAAMGVVARAIPERSEPDLDRALQAAIAHAVERGVTMVTDMGTWEGHGTYQRAYARGELPIRVYSVLPIGQWQRVAEYVEHEGRGDTRLFWGGVKGFVDGSLGSTTAWFYDPYDDAPQTTGLMVTDTAELRQAIIGADAAGLHLIVHAIGDRANDWLLGVYQEARELNRRRDRRPRIEHAQHLTPDAIRRMAVDEVIPSMQPYHAIDDGRWAVKRIGSERIETTYAFRGLQDAGAHLAFGSDWTVAPIDPLYGIYAAVTRRTIDGANPGGWVPQQKITVEEALAAYTTNNAYAAFLEGELGTLEPGKFADLVVLSHDVLTIDPVEIERVEVDLTMVAGKVVYERER
jgi:predicted amidohydrolase YtcJ